jgi:hypothetical protein
MTWRSGVLCCGLCLLSTGVEAYNDVTHQLISNEATSTASIDQSLSVDQFLKTSAGLFQGWHTHFATASGRDMSALDWLAFGALAEDVPYCRSARHFHDPLEPWAAAGLETLAPPIIAACGSSAFPSSVVWSQSADQNVGEQQSWADAGKSYLTALTGATQETRDEAWANALRSLGQVMHLVADASVPEHVRNDSHILETVFRSLHLRGYGSYEWWVEDNLGVFPFGTAPPFDRSILRHPSGDGSAPAAIARLIDTNTYAGSASGPGVTLGGSIGIAEFANANFFSEDTGNRRLLGRKYPFPALDLLDSSQHQAPHGTAVRRYYRKGNDGGIPVDPLLAECVFDQTGKAEGLPIPGSYNCVDENVWRATADHMVPRAIDYAAGVLEYFFRGRIDIAAPDRFVYGLANYVDGNRGAFTKLRFKVRNATPGEAAGAGRLIAIVQYRTPRQLGTDLIEKPRSELSPTLFFAVSKQIDVDLSGTSFPELLVDFSDNPIPTNSADLFLTVVFRGRLGIEEQAVMLGGKDLFEPDPLDIGNVSDWECFHSGPLYVANLMDFPQYHFPDQVQRDLDEDRIPDLVGPSTFRESFVKTYDPAGAVPTPSDTNYDFRMGETRAPKYGRFLLLQDRASYGAFVKWLDVHDIFGTVDHTYFYDTSLSGNRNALEVTPTGLISHVVSPPSGTYRGLWQLHGIFYVNGTTAECAPLTYDLEPSLIPVVGEIPRE